MDSCRHAAPPSCGVVGRTLMIPCRESFYGKRFSSVVGRNVGNEPRHDLAGGFFPRNETAAFHVPEKPAVLLRKIGNAAEHMRQHCEIDGFLFVEKRTGDRRAKTAFSLPTKAIPLQRANFLEIRAETFPTERNPNETTERSARGRPVLYRATLPPVRKFDR